MLASIFSLAVLSLLASSAAAQYTSTWGFCFTASSLPNSPYGPWSVATGGTLTVGAPYFYNNSGTPAASGGLRWAQNVMSASVTRTQYNRDGTVSTATLGLATAGVQGSDLVFFNSTPYTDWNGIAFAVQSSSDKPYSGSNTWIVYPNNFPVQAVELYYDLPAYNYPTEYHHDNQTNGAMVVQAGSAPSCKPAALPSSMQCAALTYQFCYQAYAAAANGQPAWQTSIQGTMLTKTSAAASSITGANGLYILSVTGTRMQSVSGGAATSVPIVGQTWHNSGGGDANEYTDDPLLSATAPFISSTNGFVLYTGSQFSYPNGSMEAINNGYALVNADPLGVSGSSVIEQQGPTPDWSAMAVSCSCSQMTCPLISSSANAAQSSGTTSGCNAQSQSMSGAQCTTSGSPTCSAPSGSSGAAQLTVSVATVLVAVAAVLALLL